MEAQKRYGDVLSFCPVNILHKVSLQTNSIWVTLKNTEKDTNTKGELEGFPLDFKLQESEGMYCRLKI